ncbi:MAG: iron-sulfur cluster insertion protein ErpA [Proteobacteria bacterium]|nr:iron-sulfur cluster insertion protein ErpA [Pseudomonadota bacterium]
MATVALTEAAAAKARQLLAKPENENFRALRVLVRDGGCSGMRYELAFDDAIADEDEKSEQHGVAVVIDPKSALYLEGTTVDFVDDLNESGFKIQNPNASTTCGCGDSFNV